MAMNTRKKFRLVAGVAFLAIAIGCFLGIVESVKEEEDPNDDSFFDEEPLFI